MEEFDFISPSDKPALIAVSSPEALAYARTALIEQGFKLHVVETHEQFESRYNQVSYQVVFLEEGFAGSPPGFNPSLVMLQNLPMAQRRFCTIFLLSGAYETLHPLQAFALSVHCVINYSELPILNQIIQKIVTDANLFTNTYREVQQRVFAQAK